MHLERILPPISRSARLGVSCTLSAARSVVSSHGIQFVPRKQVQTLPALDRLLISWWRRQAANRLPSTLEGIPVAVLRGEGSREFAYAAALEDLALD